MVFWRTSGKNLRLRENGKNCPQQKASQASRKAWHISTGPKNLTLDSMDQSKPVYQPLYDNPQRHQPGSAGSLSPFLWCPWRSQDQELDPCVVARWSCCSHLDRLCVLWPAPSRSASKWLGLVSHAQQGCWARACGQLSGLDCLYLTACTRQVTLDLAGNNFDR